MQYQPRLAFSVDRAAPVPVFEQICAAIRTQAISGDLAEGAKLPPTRTLATELGVSRSTVVTAYDQLVAEGYIDGRRGSGYVVCRVGTVELVPKKTLPPRPRGAERIPESRPFEPGLPDMRLFPHRQWARTVARVARAAPKALVTGAGAFGDPALREAVAGHIAEWRGIEAAAHRIMITAGSGDALEICIRALAEPGDRIGLENPGYPQLRNFVASLGFAQEWLRIDPQGAELPADGPSRRSRFVVLTPSHQFPLGGAMSPSRRLEFLNWAERNGSWIVEDDYDSEFRYAGRPIPAMAGFDQSDRTIYVGSFSKIFSNSLRLGYLVIPDSLIDRFEQVLGRFSVKASLLPQRPLASFIDDGEFYRHLRRVRRVYGERRRFFLNALNARVGQFGTFEDHQAGMQIAFRLPDGSDDVKIQRQARDAGITAQALSTFYAKVPAGKGLLLGFCGFSEEELDKGLAQLAPVLERNRK